MKKIILLAAILISSLGFSQVGQVVVKTDTSICLNGMKPIIYDSLSTGDKAIVDSLYAMIERVKEPVMEPVSYVKYIDDTFTITGDAYPPVLAYYADMTNERKAIIDALKDKIYEVKGVEMTSLVTKFGSELVTINGVTYPYSDFISIEFKNAILLALQFYNNQ